MNKFRILLIFTMCIMLTVFPAQAEDIVYGDLTGNGSVAVGDAIVVLRYVVGLTTLDDSQRQAADVNDDGSDAILILRYIVGLIGELPHISDILSDLFVHFIDVGQGDSILIVAPNGNTMLIDGGSRSRGDTVLNYLSQAGIDELDIVVATHPHEDHIGGLIPIIEQIDIGRMIDSLYLYSTLAYRDYWDIIGLKNIPVKTARAGKYIDLDDALTVRIIHPGMDIESYTANNSSVVIKLIYNDVGFLFAGDAETEAESEILLRGYNLSQIDVLKAGHHGSQTSTSQAFLDALSPSAAVIMCGLDNSYGHPHEETLQKLALANVDIYRTDLMGSILFVSDGLNYNVEVDPFSYDPRVNINTASLEDLQKLDGIGAVLAQGIIDERPFSSVDELTRVSGIGEVTLQKIKDQGLAYVE